MADLAKLTTTVEWLENILDNDDLSDKLNGSLAANPQLRHRVEETFRRVSSRFQSASRVTETVTTTGFDLSIAHIGCQLGLWTALVEQAPKVVEVEALATAVGAESGLVLRLLRYGAAHEMCKQINRTTFQASWATKRLAVSNVKDAIFLSYGMLAPANMAFPTYLESIKYIEPSDPNHTPWSTSIGKGKGMFEWLASNPDYAEAFNRHMTWLQGNTVSWLHGFPLDQYLSFEPSNERVQFCDVAGGNGHQALEVVQKFASLKGRVVVQDRPDMTFESHAGISFIPFDLFESNPTKGAKAYHLRIVLHDWPDSQCRTILKHLRDAMAPDSVILVNELVIRDVETRDYPTSFDIAMAIGFSAKERTDYEWNLLFTSAGLKRVALVEYDAMKGMCVQVLMKAV